MEQSEIITHNALCSIERVIDSLKTLAWSDRAAMENSIAAVRAGFAAMTQSEIIAETSNGSYKKNIKFRAAYMANLKK